jgi:type II secretory pathway component PulF
MTTGGAPPRAGPAPDGFGAARWRFHAARADGTLVEGEVESRSEREAIDQLRQRALYVTAIEPARRAPAGEAGAVRSAWGTWRRRTGGAPGTRAVATALRVVATLLEAGIPLERVLGYAAQQAADARLQEAFAAMQRDVRAGRSWSEAIADRPGFPPEVPALIAAGEASGALDAAVASLADTLEARAAWREQLRSALLYPALLAVASVLGTLVVLFVAVPRFIGLVADGTTQLPLATRLLVWTSTVVRRGGLPLLGVIAVTALGVPTWLRTPSRRRWLDGWTLRLPWIGDRLRARDGSRYLATLGMALSAGVSLLPAMRLATGGVGNTVLGEALARAEGLVQDGGAVASALRGVLPPLAVQLLAAGEESGALAPAATRAARVLADEVQRAVQRAVTLVEPVMILGFGGVVGFVALALLQAVYGLNARVL